MYLPYFKTEIFNITLANNFIKFEQLGPGLLLWIMGSMDMADSTGKNALIRLCVCANQPGSSCSKLMTSLVNDSLKFKWSDTQICCNFLLKKCE